MNAIVEFVLLLILLGYLQPAEPWGLVAIGLYIIWKPLSWVFLTLLERSIKHSADSMEKAAKKVTKKCPKI